MDMKTVVPSHLMERLEEAGMDTTDVVAVQPWVYYETLDRINEFWRGV